MYLIDRFSQLLRCEVVLHFINTWDIKHPLSCNFYVRTCAKFAFANKIETMYERPHVQLCKRESSNSLNLTFNLNTLYLTSINFIYVIEIYVRYRAEPKTRQWKSPLTLGTCYGCVYTGSFELDYPHTSCPWNRNPISSFSGTGWSKNFIAWKCWLFWNNWSLQWSKKKKNVKGVVSRNSSKLGNYKMPVELRET